MRPVARETVELLGVKAEVARSFPARARGLIGRDGLAPGCGLLIEKCNAIHTFFMRFPIDAVFLDRNNRPVKVVRGIRPWRIFVWGGFRAVKTLELDSRNRGIRAEIS